MGYKFKIDLHVRDYECDMQGYVNNAVYQNYLEHARHEYLQRLGINFAILAKQKVDIHSSNNQRVNILGVDDSTLIITEPIIQVELGMEVISDIK